MGPHGGKCAGAAVRRSWPLLLALAQCTAGDVLQRLFMDYAEPDTVQMGSNRYVPDAGGAVADVGTLRAADKLLRHAAMAHVRYRAGDLGAKVAPRPSFRAGGDQYFYGCHRCRYAGDAWKMGHECTFALEPRHTQWHNVTATGYHGAELFAVTLLHWTCAGWERPSDCCGAQCCRRQRVLSTAGWAALCVSAAALACCLCACAAAACAHRRRTRHRDDPAAL